MVIPLHHCIIYRCEVALSVSIVFVDVLYLQICQIGRLRTFPEEDNQARDRLIKEMILKRGCNVDVGNLPETLIMKRGGLQTSCNDKQSVEERVLVGSHCKHLQHQHNGICGEHQDRNSVDIHEQEFQQHGIITTVANNVLCNKDNFNTQTSSPGCNSDTCQVLSFTFQPRPSKESTRNCTTLDRSLKDHIVNTVARKLLGLPLASDKLASTSHTASEMDKQAATSAAGASKWQKGGIVV